VSVLWSFAAGAAFVLLCLVLSASTEADALVSRRYGIPDRLRVVADHGRIRPLPRRVPMASLKNEPPSVWHVSPRRVRVTVDWEMNAFVFLVVSALTMIINLARRYVDDVARWVMSPIFDGEFNEWWEETWTNERKRTYHGRRRYDEVSLRTEWRTRWAEHDTQSWPTLATSGNAWDLVPTLSPMSEKALVICTGMTFNTSTHVMPVEHVARNLSENPRLLHTS